jgi:ADP-heptose:LPS heptosyltransferase
VNHSNPTPTSLDAVSPVTSWPLPPVGAPEAEAVIPFTMGRNAPPRTPPGHWEPGHIQQTDFGADRTPVARIVVLKLDHFGDFVIGLPALRALRTAFPKATIRLICGSWNERNALACGLVDEVRCFDFFPEHPQRGDWNGTNPLTVLDRAAEGRFDLAIDLRVDEDTRHLLGRIDAGLRCGIGSATRFPMLNIALPDEHAERGNTAVADGQFRFLPPDHFHSVLPIKTPFYQAGRFVQGELVRGPFMELPTGRLRAAVGLVVKGHLPGPFAASVKVDILRDGGQVIGSQIFGRSSLHRLRRDPVVFEFDNMSERSKFEFRIQVAGRPLSGTVQFSGVSVQRLEAAPAPRFRPVEIHVGEKLSLLIALIRERTADLYRGLLSAAGPAAPLVPRAAGLRRIAIAPFSNSTIRDWPPRHYARLIALLLERLPCEVLLLGTAEQVAASRSLTDQCQSPNLVNLIGRTAWSDLPGLLRSSNLVICNNSGIAHLAAAAGAPVLAIFSGSHQPQEWGPRGMRSRAIMHYTPCSPCGFERLAECPKDHACMEQITPDYVLGQAESMLQSIEQPAEMVPA